MKWGHPKLDLRHAEATPNKGSRSHRPASVHPPASKLILLQEAEHVTKTRQDLQLMKFHFLFMKIMEMVLLSSPFCNRNRRACQCQRQGALATGTKSSPGHLRKKDQEGGRQKREAAAAKAWWAWWASSFSSPLFWFSAWSACSFSQEGPATPRPNHQSLLRDLWKNIVQHCSTAVGMETMAWRNLAGPIALCVAGMEKRSAATEFSQPRPPRGTLDATWQHGDATAAERFKDKVKVCQISPTSTPNSKDIGPSGRIRTHHATELQIPRSSHSSALSLKDSATSSKTIEFHMGKDSRHVVFSIVHSRSASSSSSRAITT